MKNRNPDQNHNKMQQVRRTVLHTFVICAYQESPYLEECIRSLLRQTVRGRVLIATSTPNRHILELADRYKIPAVVHKGGSLAKDWNAALECVRTEYVTLAHQDDVYGRHYTEDVLRALRRSEHPLIAFTDYAELRMGSEGAGRLVTDNRMLRIKRLMLSPLRMPSAWGSRLLRRRILSFGNPVCCPSVTFALRNLELPVFEDNMKSNIDWQAWERISGRKGDFVYVPKIEMAHRIHTGSTTSELIRGNRRREEDLVVYRKFWPEWTARIIEKIYQKSEASNRV